MQLLQEKEMAYFRPGTIWFVGAEEAVNTLVSDNCENTQIQSSDLLELPELHKCDILGLFLFYYYYICMPIL